MERDRNNLYEGIILLFYNLLCLSMLNLMCFNTFVFENFKVIVFVVGKLIPFILVIVCIFGLIKTNKERKQKEEKPNKASIRQRIEG